ncbi:MAG: hypothetical protein ACYCYM_14555 [Saccharofermentanales bacterium]
MILLEFDNGIKLFEEKEDYKGAIDFLLDMWQRDCSDLNSLLCFATQLWHTLVYWQLDEEIPGLDRQKIADLYTETVNYGFEHFAEEERFLVIIGYILHIDFFWYGDFNGNDVHQFQKKCKNMIRQASKLNPQSLVAKLFLCERFDRRKKLEQEIEPVFNQYFVGDSNVINYFRGICCP